MGDLSAVDLKQIVLVWQLELHPNIPSKPPEFAITWWTSPPGGLTGRSPHGNLRRMQ
jgi:hypothetical protein